VVKVSIADTQSVGDSLTSSAPEALQTAQRDTSKTRKLVYVLIIIAIMGLGLTYIAMKKKKGANVNPFKANKK
jgi:hypothetical protein